MGHSLPLCNGPGWAERVHCRSRIRSRSPSPKKPGCGSKRKSKHLDLAFHGLAASRQPRTCRTQQGWRISQVQESVPNLPVFSAVVFGLGLSAQWRAALRTELWRTRIALLGLRACEPPHSYLSHGTAITRCREQQRQVNGANVWITTHAASNVGV